MVSELDRVEPAAEDTAGVIPLHLPPVPIMVK